MRLSRSTFGGVSLSLLLATAATSLFASIKLITRHLVDIGADTSPEANSPTQKSLLLKGSSDVPYSACNNALFTTPMPIFWNKHEAEIKEAAILRHEYLGDQNNTHLDGWIDALFRNYYQSYQVRRSSIHPPSLNSTLKVLDIINKRVDYILKKEKSDNQEDLPPAPPQLHIAVTGGSVTQGINCQENSIGLKTDYRKLRECAWPARLQELFNRVLFHGRDVVKVTNLAVGGSSSEIGRVLLEYQLFPNNFEMPHVVIWAHAANDVQEKDKNKVYFESMPGYVNAAHNLRMCDDDLPLVVMNEEFFHLYQTNELSGMIYKISSWFGLMGVSHRNVIGRIGFANSDKPEIIKEIYGGDINLHPGMGVHIGVAWTVFYNFISAFTDACDYTRVLSSHINKNDVTAKSIGPYEETTVPTAEAWKKHQSYIEEACSPSDNNSPGSVPPCTYAFMVHPITPVSRAAHVQSKMNEVMTYNVGWKAEGNPVKQPRAGWYAKEANATFSLTIDVSMETKYVTIMSMKSYGDNFKDTKVEVTVQILQNWESEIEMVDKAAAREYGVLEQPSKMQFYSNTSAVSFCGDDFWRDTQIRCNERVQYLHKSYAITVDEAISSLLKKGECACIQTKAAGTKNSISGPDPDPLPHVTPKKAVAKYEITGYHETKTSIHVPHKFKLPNDGAKEGDKLQVNFHLVSGSYFKIAGLAFCRF